MSSPFLRSSFLKWPQQIVHFKVNLVRHVVSTYYCWLLSRLQVWSVTPPARVFCFCFSFQRVGRKQLIVFCNQHGHAHAHSCFSFCFFSLYLLFVLVFSLLVCFDFVFSVFPVSCYAFFFLFAQLLLLMTDFYAIFGQWLMDFVLTHTGVWEHL